MLWGAGMEKENDCLVRTGVWATGLGVGMGVEGRVGGRGVEGVKDEEEGRMT